VGKENFNKAEKVANPFLCIYSMLQHATVKIWVQRHCNSTDLQWPRTLASISREKSVGIHLAYPTCGNHTPQTSSLPQSRWTEKVLPAVTTTQLLQTVLYWTPSRSWI